MTILSRSVALKRHHAKARAYSKKYGVSYWYARIMVSNSYKKKTIRINRKVGFKC